MTLVGHFLPFSSLLFFNILFGGINYFGERYWEKLYTLCRLEIQYKSLSIWDNFNNIDTRTHGEGNPVLSGIPSNIDIHLALPYC